MSLEVKVSIDGETQFYAGLAGDVSRGGLFVATYQDIAIGTELALAFTLPDAGVVRARGVVRWKRPANEGVAPGLGIAFADLAPDDVRKVEVFSDARPPLYLDLGG